MAIEGLEAIEAEKARLQSRYRFKVGVACLVLAVFIGWLLTR